MVPRRKSLKLGGQMELAEAPPTPGAPSHPPIVLDLGPGPARFVIAVWSRDENGTPVYKITQRDIRAAKEAATMARQRKPVGT